MSTLMDFEKENEAQIYEHYLVHAMQEKICEIMNRKKVSKTDLAKKMNVSKSEVSRLLGEGRNLNLRTIAKIFFALGEELEIKAKSDTKKITETYWKESRTISQIWQSTDVSIHERVDKQKVFHMDKRIRYSLNYSRKIYAK